MKTRDWLEKTNLMNQNYLAQLIAMITLLDEGEEIQLGLVQVKKVKKTEEGYLFEVKVDDIELDELREYFKID
jgi:hypothetical protein